MIPVQKMVEPTKFDVLVRRPGYAFLKANPTPTNKEWGKYRYWKRVTKEIYSAYNEICSYLGEWISAPSIDHFMPKNRYPHLAYEWDNYRLSSPKMNSYKGNNENIADPFTLKTGWFILDFPSCLVWPGPDLSKKESRLVQNTIDVLKLNDDDNLVQNRCNILLDYSQGDVTYNYLKKRYPFIASELKRQAIIETVKTMFKKMNS